MGHNLVIGAAIADDGVKLRQLAHSCRTHLTKLTVIDHQHMVLRGA